MQLTKAFNIANIITVLLVVSAYFIDMAHTYQGQDTFGPNAYTQPWSLVLLAVITAPTIFAAIIIRAEKLTVYHSGRFLVNVYARLFKLAAINLHNRIGLAYFVFKLRARNQYQLLKLKITSR